MQIAFLLLVFASTDVHAKVVQSLPTNDKVVALTFDACGRRFDAKLLDYLVSNRIPFTVFATGRFIVANQKDMAKLARLSFVQIENHSWSHPGSMSRLSPARIRREVARTEAAILKATGRRPAYFRFPGGSFNALALSTVERMGYTVVHWRWASGDPERDATAAKLARRAGRKTRPGDILIFHINGRGRGTADALPAIVNTLRERGYRFVTLSAYLDRECQAASGPHCPSVAASQTPPRSRAKR